MVTLIFKYSLDPKPRAGWAMGNLFHLNELGQRQEGLCDYSSPLLSLNLGKQPPLYLGKHERETKGRRELPDTLSSVDALGRKRLRGKGKVKRWSRLPAEESDPHS